MSRGQGLEKSEEEQILEEAFNLCDHDKNGTICSSEIGLCLRALSLNPTDKEIKEIVDEIDKNKSGRIEFCEFRDYYKKVKEKSKNKKEDIMCAFQFFDKDGNGFIEAKELKEILTNLGDCMTDEQISQMIEVADVDKDGQINYKEFAEFMCKPVK